MLSQPIGSGNAVISVIAFTDVNLQEEGLDSQAVEGNGEDLDAIQLGVLGDSPHQVVEGITDDSEAIHQVLRDGVCQV